MTEKYLAGVTVKGVVKQNDDLFELVDDLFELAKSAKSNSLRAVILVLILHKCHKKQIDGVIATMQLEHPEFYDRVSSLYLTYNADELDDYISTAIQNIKSSAITGLADRGIINELIKHYRL